MTEIKIKTPGKLFVAGEYAVVEAGYSAIITAVDRFIYLTIKGTTKDYGEIFSSGFTKEPAKWARSRNRFWLQKQNYRLKYVRSAIHTTERYLYELKIPLKLFDLEISSELKDENGKKLGLGSSGAITVGTVRAVLQFYGVKDKDKLVYKLSVLAQFNLGDNSSFGDLAASSYTGWINYTNFDHQYVIDRFKRMPSKRLIELDWPSLEIERLDVSESIRFLIGWTGNPASSNRLVGDVQKQKKQSNQDYQYFLNESKKSVDQLADSLQTNHTKGIKQAVERNRKALLEMGKQTGVMIETPALKKLIETAGENDAVAKTSGAGGGDSGIAFVFDNQNLSTLINDWTKVGITHLPLKIYQKQTMSDGGLL